MCFGARDIDGEILALALAGKERVEIAFNQADLGVLLLGQGIIPHLLDDGVRIGIESQAAGIAKGELGRRRGEGPDFFLFDEDGAKSEISPGDIGRLLPLDIALAIAEQRFRQFVPARLG